MAKLTGDETYQRDLFDHMHSVDVLIAILRECAVGHHGVLAALISVVHRDDHGEVIFY